MKIRLLHILLFFTILIVADQLVGTAISFLAQKQNRDNRIGLLLDGKFDADIIVIGSSRALNNYSPEIISKETGLSCYNLGVSGSNITYHESMVDLVLKSHNKPTAILYNVDDYGAFFQADGIVYRKDVLYPYVSNEYVNKLVCEQLHKRHFATYLSKTYRENVNFINAIKYLLYGRENVDYKTTNFDTYGANILVQRSADRPPVFGKERIRISESIMDTALTNSFVRIQEKCVNANVKLFLIVPPLYSEPTKGFKNLVMKNKNKDVLFYDFEGVMQNPDLFFNQDHMNSRGAEVFSEMVAKSIKNSLE